MTPVRIRSYPSFSANDAMSDAVSKALISVLSSVRIWMPLDRIDGHVLSYPEGLFEGELVETVHSVGPLKVKLPAHRAGLAGSPPVNPTGGFVYRYDSFGVGDLFYADQNSHLLSCQKSHFYMPLQHYTVG
jgi:hypothetical protein